MKDLINKHLECWLNCLSQDIMPKDLRKDRTRKRTILTGDVPSPLNPLGGCRFHTDCPIAMDVCKKAVPEWERSHAWSFCGMSCGDIRIEHHYQVYLDLNYYENNRWFLRKILDRTSFCSNRYSESNSVS